MLGNIIHIILLTIFVLFTFRNYKQGIILFVVFSLVSPHFKIANNIISFDILAFPLLFLIIILKNRKIFSIYRTRHYRQHLWLYLFLVIIATLFGVLKYPVGVNLFALFAYFRWIILVHLLQFLMNEDPDVILDKILTSILSVNIIVSIIQLLYPKSIVLFYDLYFKPSLTPLSYVLNLGYFNRAYGTFGTPVLLGIFSFLCFSIYLGFFAEKKKVKYIRLKIFGVISLGLMALSKTVIVGIPLILIAFYLLSFIGFFKIKNKRIIYYPLILGAVFFIVASVLENYMTHASWHMKFLFEPTSVFSTRYDSTAGILSETYDVIKENFIIGLGFSNVDLFIGDSMYIVLLLTSGLLGTIYFLGVLLSATIKNFKLMNTTGTLCFISLCIAGLAAPVHIGVESAIILAYIFSIAESTRQMRKNIELT